MKKEQTNIMIDFYLIHYSTLSLNDSYNSS